MTTTTESLVINTRSENLGNGLELEITTRFTPSGYHGYFGAWIGPSSHYSAVASKEGKPLEYDDNLDINGIIRFRNMIQEKYVVVVQ